MDGKHNFGLSFNMGRNCRILLYLARVDNLHKKSKKKNLRSNIRAYEHTEEVELAKYQWLNKEETRLHCRERFTDPENCFSNFFSHMKGTTNN